MLGPLEPRVSTAEATDTGLGLRGGSFGEEMLGGSSLRRALARQGQVARHVFGSVFGGGAKLGGSDEALSLTESPQKVGVVLTIVHLF